MEGLEALKQILEATDTNFIYQYHEDLENPIKFIEKELTALRIIKNKKVDLEYLKCCKNYKQYKTVCSYWNEITEEEYELLKEVLNDEK